MCSLRPYLARQRPGLKIHNVKVVKTIMTCDLWLFQGVHNVYPLKLVKIFAGMIKQLRTQMADMAVIDMSITSIRHHKHILHINVTSKPLNSRRHQDSSAVLIICLKSIKCKINIKCVFFFFCVPTFGEGGGTKSQLLPRKKCSKVDPKMR